MKLSCFAVAFFTVALGASLVVISSPAVQASTCTGSAHCSACSSCSQCNHCTSGGSCGVCAAEKKRARKIQREMDADVERVHKLRAAYGAYWREHGAPPPMDDKPAPTPKPKPTPTPDPNAFHALHVRRTVVVAQQVGLRKTASDTSARLQMLKHGTTVIVVAMQAGHYKVMTLDNKIGYVPKKAVGAIDEMISVPVKH